MYEIWGGTQFHSQQQPCAGGTLYELGLNFFFFPSEQSPCHIAGQEQHLVLDMAFVAKDIFAGAD